MSSMRVLVTEAGAVGSYIQYVFRDAEFVLTDVRGNVRAMDIADPEAVAATVREVEPDLVLHHAAATDVGQWERDPDLAFRANAIATQNVALARRNAGCELRGSAA